MDIPEVIPTRIPDLTGFTLLELAELLDRDRDLRAAVDQLVQDMLNELPDDDGRYGCRRC